MAPFTLFEWFAKSTIATLAIVRLRNFREFRVMPNQPRKHHYVPQFYLAAFTDSGTVDGNLHVIDTTRLKTWVSKPKDAAHQRDFHEVDVGPESDPMGVEKILGQFEGRWSTVLRSVLELRALPADNAFADLMIFIAFMAVRVPRIRETISNFLEEVRRKEEFARKCLEQQGHQVGATTDDFEAFDQTWHVQQMVRLAIGLAPLLSLRHWNLWIAEDQAPDLICSDSPVVPTSAIPTSGLHSPGFRTSNTVVSVPLGKRVALVSMLDVDVGPRMLGRNEVAQLNSATGMYAGQLYCPAADFVWLTRDGRVGGRDDLLQALGGNPS
jgi:hypothetical protein